MKKVVTFGEIMLRLAPPGFLRFSQTTSFDVVYGGGESNVAVSLANYGVPVEFVTRLPNNDIGQCALMEMRKRGVGTEKIIYGGDRLGIYFLETGAVSRGSKVVYDRAHSAMADIAAGMIDWEHVFNDVSWFHWTGITPAISQGAADACLEAVKAASEMGVTISTDLNYIAVPRLSISIRLRALLFIQVLIFIPSVLAVLNKCIKDHEQKVFSTCQHIVRKMAIIMLQFEALTMLTIASSVSVFLIYNETACDSA